MTEKPEMSPVQQSLYFLAAIFYCSGVGAIGAPYAGVAAWTGVYAAYLVGRKYR